MLSIRFLELPTQRAGDAYKLDLESELVRVLFLAFQSILGCVDCNVYDCGDGDGRMTVDVAAVVR